MESFALDYNKIQNTSCHGWRVAAQLLLAFDDLQTVRRSDKTDKRVTMLCVDAYLERCVDERRGQVSYCSCSKMHQWFIGRVLSNNMIKLANEKMVGFLAVPCHDQWLAIPPYSVWRALWCTHTLRSRAHAKESKSWLPTPCPHKDSERLPDEKTPKRVSNTTLSCSRLVLGVG